MFYAKAETIAAVQCCKNCMKTTLEEMFSMKIDVTLYFDNFSYINADPLTRMCIYIEVKY